MHSLNETYECPANDFVAGPASGMVRYRDLVFHPFVRSHQGAVLLKALGEVISVLWIHFFSSYRKIWVIVHNLSLLSHLEH